MLTRLLTRPQRRMSQSAAQSRQPQLGKSYVRQALVCWAGLLLLTAQAVAAGADATPASLQPYRVVVSMVFANDALLPATTRKSIVSSLTASIGRAYGAMWNARVVENDWLYPPNDRGLAGASDESIRQHIDNEVDKLFLVSIDQANGKFHIAVREWDAATRTLGRLFTRETYNRSSVTSDAFALVCDAFRPTVVIDVVDGDSVEVLTRAGEFPPADPGAAEFAAGTLLVPCFRYLNREGELQRVQFLPWTYLMVQDVDRARAVCRVISGLRSPLGGGGRRRIEVVAIVERPTYPSTRLRLLPYANPSQPMIGYHVTVSNELPEASDAEPELLSLLSDRRGTVDIAVDPAHPVRWLYVRSSDTLLARVPFIPGIAPQATLELPDDSLRLGVEGKISLMRGELIDTVARRAVLMARARTEARIGRYDSAIAELAKIDDLPTLRSYELQLNSIRVPAIENAQKQRNRAAEARIRKMCNDARTVIDRYLNNDKVRDLKNEIAELRRSR